MGKGNKRAGRKNRKENDDAEVVVNNDNADCESEKEIAERVRVAQGLYDIDDVIGVVNSKKYPQNNGKTGTLQRIDDGLLYGSWGRGFIDPTTDTFRVFKKEYLSSQLDGMMCEMPKSKRGRKKKI